MSTKVDSSNNVEFGTSAQLLPMQCCTLFFCQNVKNENILKIIANIFGKCKLVYYICIINNKQK